MKELQETRTARWQQASQAKAVAEDWLRHGKPSGVQLLDYEGPEPKLLKNESITDAVERLRRRCRELRADAHRVSSSPYPSSYCKQRLRQIVEQFAARAVPDVSGLIEHDSDIVWPTQQVRSAIYSAQGAAAFHEAIDVVGLLANLLKPAMISYLVTRS